MNDIKKYRQLLDEASYEASDDFIEEINELPSYEIFEDDHGMSFLFMYMESEQLDEGLRSSLSKIFSQSKNLMQDIKSGAEDSYKKAMRKITTKFNARMSPQMKKQVKQITKRLKDQYYFHYNALLPKYQANNKIYSKPFFEDLITSFGLNGDVEKEVLAKYRPQYTKMYKSMHDMYKEYQQENPKAPKPKPNQVYAYLPKKLKKKVDDDYAYLIGSLIGFTTAVAIADYFKKNPVKFKECNEFEFAENDINGILLNTQVDNLVENINEHHDSIIMEQLESECNEDDEFDWSDDIEEEHDTIYDQFIKGKK